MVVSSIKSKIIKISLQILFISCWAYNSCFLLKGQTLYSTEKFSPCISKYFEPYDTGYYDIIPFISKMSLACDVLFNTDDILVGGSIGIHTKKFNLSFYAGYDRRPKAINIAVKQTSGDYLLAQERRSIIYLAFVKRFGIPVGMSKIGILFQAKEIYIYGKWKYNNEKKFNYNVKTEFNFKNNFVPCIGIFWMNDDAIIKFTYEPIDFDEYIVFKNYFNNLQKARIKTFKINFSFVYCFHFYKKIKF